MSDHLKNKNINIRKAKREDTIIIHSFIKKLAEYEKLEQSFTATPELLEEWLFDKEKAFVLIGKYNNIPVGYALYFYSFSTFIGKGGIYLEDLFVLPEYRNMGVGKLLLCKIAKECSENGFERLEWACLDWNTGSIGFYESIGAERLDGWLNFRLNKNMLNNFIRGCENEQN